MANSLVIHNSGLNKYMVILYFMLICNFPLLSQGNILLKLEILDCVDSKKDNEITFIIENNSDHSVNVTTSFLVISKVLNQDREEIAINKRLMHRDPENLPEYVIIPPSSTKRIQVTVNYFKKYDLPKGKKFKAIGMYDAPYRRKKDRGGLTTMYTSPTEFSACR